MVTYMLHLAKTPKKRWRGEKLDPGYLNWLLSPKGIEDEEAREALKKFTNLFPCSKPSGIGLKAKTSHKCQLAKDCG